MQYARSIALLEVTVLILSELVNGQTSDITYPTDIFAYEGTECETSGGLKGICRSIGNCSVESSRLITRMDLCSFRQRTPIYCCANSQEVNPVENKESKIPDKRLEGTDCITTGGLKGICSSTNGCSLEAFYLIKDKDFCSYSFLTPIYCCGTSQEDNPIENSGSKMSANILNDTSRIDPNKNPSILWKKEVYAKFLNDLRPADKICERYYPSNVRKQGAFVGGTRSLVDQHPHMTAIGWTSTDGEVDWKCGGSVVTAKFIITAGHCTKNTQGIRPDIARTGDLNLLVTENNTHPEDYNITEVHVHPDYNDTLTYHDIALLKISPDFKWEPICLWTSPEFPYKTMLGMGYGTTAFGGPRSNELFEGYLTVTSHEECASSIPISSSLPNGIITGQFCAIDPKHLQDTCQGDSGGPLQFWSRSGYSYRPALSGITSFGQYCAGRAPGVFTKVSSYLDWLEPILLSDF